MNGKNIILDLKARYHYVSKVLISVRNVGKSELYVITVLQQYIMLYSEDHIIMMTQLECVYIIETNTFIHRYWKIEMFHQLITYEIT